MDTIWLLLVIESSSLLTNLLLIRLLSQLRQPLSEETSSSPRTGGVPQSHTTVPSYDPPVQGRGANVISPKSPQQLEAEAEERSMKRNLVDRTLHPR